jgi:hypothetical protein
VLGELIDLDLSTILIIVTSYYCGQYLAEFADISNALSIQGFEVGGDSAILKVNNAGERFIKKGTNGLNREATGFSGKSMNHSFETKINFPTADDLGDV